MLLRRGGVTAHVLVIGTAQVETCYALLRYINPPLLITPFFAQDEGLIPDEKESRILEVLQKIRAKDPAVFDPTVKFFPDSEGEEQEDHAKGEPYSPVSD